MSQARIFTFRYHRLTVADAKVDDMIMPGERAVFQPTRLEVANDHRMYNVEYAIVDGVTYFKSLMPYPNYEFMHDILSLLSPGTLSKAKWL